MNIIVKAVIVLLLTNLLVTACSSAPAPKRDPYNDADSQRTRADSAQGELSSETVKKQ